MIVFNCGVFIIWWKGALCCRLVFTLWFPKFGVAIPVGLAGDRRFLAFSNHFKKKIVRVKVCFIKTD